MTPIPGFPLQEVHKKNLAGFCQVFYSPKNHSSHRDDFHLLFHQFK